MQLEQACNTTANIERGRRLTAVAEKIGMRSNKSHHTRAHLIQRAVNTADRQVKS